jgi:hypothetical protein
MKIEAGKFYKTRDGRKAYVGSIDDDEDYPVNGYLVEESDYWMADGKGNDHCGLDLIAPWEDEPQAVDKAAFRQYACAALTGLLARISSGLVIAQGAIAMEAAEIAKQMMEEEAKL